MYVLVVSWLIGFFRGEIWNGVVLFGEFVYDEVILVVSLDGI